MSILNGSISYGALGAEHEPFGRKLTPETTLPLAGCMNLALDPSRRYCYALSSRGLVVLDIADTASPTELASLSEIRGGRDIVFHRGFVYIAAREFGLYVVSVEDPYAPRLVYTHDSLELATSVDVSGDLCLVANRHLGVELLDISTPDRPRFLSSYLAGEAQCVHLAGDLAIVGDWMNRRVHVTDISDPAHPRPVSTFSVDGYADGVYLSDGICYVATGHHSGRLTNRYRFDGYPFLTPELIASGYGCGHGLELFDLSDPRQPEYLSSLKLPPAFSAPDLWKVTAAAGRAYVSDSSNGLFVINVEDKHKPYFEAYLRDIPKSVGYVTRPQVQPRCAPITACHVLDGMLLLAASETGIHFVRYDAARDEKQILPTARERILEAEVLCTGLGQVHAAIPLGENLLVAAGNGGLLCLAPDGSILDRVGELSLDVRVSGEYVLSAEGLAGVASYRFGGGKLLPVDRKDVPGVKWTVRELAVLRPDLVAAQLGARKIAFYSLAEDGRLEHLSDTVVAGMIYYRNLSSTPLKGEAFAYASLREGVSWISIKDNGFEKLEAPLGIESCPLEDGVAVTEDYAIVISCNRYGFLTDPAKTPSIEFIDGDLPFRGVPIILGDRLVLLRRTYGECALYDIADPRAPRYLGTAKIPSPASASRLGDTILISCGHSGIYRLPANPERN